MALVVRRESKEESKQDDQKNLRIVQANAAARIQALARRSKARKKVLKRLRKVVEREFDQEKGLYYYYNAMTQQSSWTPPLLLQGQPFEEKDEWAATVVQCAYRCHKARKKVGQVVDTVYQKAYSREAVSWFYYNKVTGVTTWDKPKILGAREPPVHEADVAVKDKEEEIQQLRQKLLDAEKKAQDIDKQLKETTNTFLVKTGQLGIDEAKGRSKHMDEWSIADVKAWFEEIGFKEYAGAIEPNKVDGLLLLHLSREDWGYLGIKSPLHARRLEVAINKYRLRFEHKQAGGNDDESDNFSDMSASSTPSELYADEAPDTFIEDQQMEQDVDGDLRPSEDAMRQQRLDEENIKKEVIFPGDSSDAPLEGDVVKIHYTINIQGSGKLVESTRKMRRQAFEFVLGAGMVAKGLDKAVASMTFGERSRFTISPAYCYGELGYPPVMPPNATLIFNIDLVRFWERPRWNRPLLQVTGPYTETPYANRAMHAGVRFAVDEDEDD